VSDLDLPIGSILPAETLRSPGAEMLRGLGRPGAKRDDKALVQAAKDFESVLLHKLLEEMGNTVGDSGLLGDGASEQFRGIFWSFLAREVAQQGGVGLWKQLYEQWSRAADAGGVELPAKEMSP
jgi:Rod binding domain-containing protein